MVALTFLRIIVCDKLFALTHIRVNYEAFAIWVAFFSFTMHPIIVPGPFIHPTIWVKQDTVSLSLPIQMLSDILEHIRIEAYTDASDLIFF